MYKKHNHTSQDFVGANSGGRPLTCTGTVFGRSTAVSGTEGLKFFIMVKNKQW